MKKIRIILLVIGLLHIMCCEVNAESKTQYYSSVFSDWGYTVTYQTPLGTQTKENKEKRVFLNIASKVEQTEVYSNPDDYTYDIKIMICDAPYRTTIYACDKNSIMSNTKALTIYQNKTLEVTYNALLYMEGSKHVLVIPENVLVNDMARTKLKDYVRQITTSHTIDTKEKADLTQYIGNVQNIFVEKKIGDTVKASILIGLILLVITQYTKIVALFYKYKNSQKIRSYFTRGAIILLCLDTFVFLLMLLVKCVKHKGEINIGYTESILLYFINPLSLAPIMASGSIANLIIGVTACIVCLNLSIVLTIFSLKGTKYVVAQRKKLYPNSKLLNIAVFTITVLGTLLFLLDPNKTGVQWLIGTYMITILLGNSYGNINNIVSESNGKKIKYITLITALLATILFFYKNFYMQSKIQYKYANLFNNNSIVALPYELKSSNTIYYSYISDPFKPVYANQYMIYHPKIRSINIKPISKMDDKNAKSTVIYATNFSEYLSSILNKSLNINYAVTDDLEDIIYIKHESIDYTLPVSVILHYTCTGNITDSLIKYRVNYLNKNGAFITSKASNLLYFPGCEHTDNPEIETYSDLQITIPLATSDSIIELLNVPPKLNYQMVLQQNNKNIPGIYIKNLNYDAIIYDNVKENVYSEDVYTTDDDVKSITITRNENTIDIAEALNLLIRDKLISKKIIITGPEVLSTIEK